MFDEYRPALLHCIVDSKLRHGERSVRELAAKSVELVSLDWYQSSESQMMIGIDITSTDLPNV